MNDELKIDVVFPDEKPGKIVIPEGPPAPAEMPVEEPVTPVEEPVSNHATSGEEPEKDADPEPIVEDIAPAPESPAPEEPVATFNPVVEEPDPDPTPAVEEPVSDHALTVEESAEDADPEPIVEEAAPVEEPDPRVYKISVSDINEGERFGEVLQGSMINYTMMTVGSGYLLLMENSAGQKDIGFINPTPSRMANYHDVVQTLVKKIRESSCDQICGVIA